MLTVLLLLALILNLAFVFYAFKFGPRAFEVLRILSFVAWPLGAAVHILDLVHIEPMGLGREGLDPTRNLCFQDYSLGGNFVTAIMYVVVAVVVVSSFVIWLSWGFCFPRVIDAPFAIYRKNARRLTVLILAIVPTFASLVYCELSPGPDCPDTIENVGELASACFMWVTYFFAGFLSVNRWRDIYERDLDFVQEAHVQQFLGSNIVSSGGGSCHGSTIVPRDLDLEGQRASETQSTEADPEPDPERAPEDTSSSEWSGSQQKEDADSDPGFLGHTAAAAPDVHRVSPAAPASVSEAILPENDFKDFSHKDLQRLQGLR